MGSTLPLVSRVRCDADLDLVTDSYVSADAICVAKAAEQSCRMITGTDDAITGAWRT